MIGNWLQWIALGGVWQKTTVLRVVQHFITTLPIFYAGLALKIRVFTVCCTAQNSNLTEALHQRQAAFDVDAA